MERFARASDRTKIKRPAHRREVAKRIAAIGDVKQLTCILSKHVPVRCRKTHSPEEKPVIPEQSELHHWSPQRNAGP